MKGVAISHDGRLVAVGCYDRIIRIWDVQTGHLVERLRGHGESVRSVTFTPDDKGLISGSDDRKVKHWDLSPFLQHDARMEPLPPAAFPAPVSTSVLGPNTGVPVKEGGERGSICLTTFSGHILDVSSVAVSHDGQWLVSGSDDKNVLFWDVRSAQAHFALHGHKGWTVSVDMSPTGNLIATGDSEGNIRICKLFYSTQ